MAHSAQSRTYQVSGMPYARGVIVDVGGWKRHYESIAVRVDMQGVHSGGQDERRLALLEVRAFIRTAFHCH